MSDLTPTRRGFKPTRTHAGAPALTFAYRNLHDLTERFRDFGWTISSNVALAQRIFMSLQCIILVTWEWQFCRALCCSEMWRITLQFISMPDTLIRMFGDSRQGELIILITVQPRLNALTYIVIHYSASLLLEAV